MKEGVFYQCESCSYQTKRKPHLLRHLKEKHGSNERIQCEYCHKTYKNERCFAQHGCFKNLQPDPFPNYYQRT